MDGIQLLHGDCLELMQDIPDHSVDAIICDLPYGTTACKWDSIIPFDKLWEQYKRVIKPKGAIVLFGSQPFTTDLIMSNRKWFKYCLVWDKMRGTDWQLANVKPLKSFEDIIIFGQGRITYNPQMILRDKPDDRTNSSNRWVKNTSHKIMGSKFTEAKLYTHKYPTTVLTFSNQSKDCNNSNKLHPTQKPIALLEWLVKTYSNEGETILDNCMGSGTTGVACVNTNRNFIGIEKDLNYFNIASKRIQDTMQDKNSQLQFDTAS